MPRTRQYTVTFQSNGGWGPPTYSLTAESGGDVLIKGVTGDIGSVNGTPAAGLVRLLINEG